MNANAVMTRSFNAPPPHPPLPQHHGNIKESQLAFQIRVKYDSIFTLILIKVHS